MKESQITFTNNQRTKAENHTCIKSTYRFIVAPKYSPFFSQNRCNFLQKTVYIPSPIFKGFFSEVMTEHEEHKVEKEEQDESLMDKISEKLHFSNHSSSPAPASSSSDSDDEKKKPTSPAPETSSFGTKVRRLFGRERPVHKVFGGGKREFSLFLLQLFVEYKIELERIWLVLLIF